MQTPLQITLRHMAHTHALTTRVRDEVGKLSGGYPDIVSCRVIIGQQDRHKSQGRSFNVLIALGVPGHELIVNHDHDEARQRRAARQRPWRSTRSRLCGCPCAFMHLERVGRMNRETAMNASELDSPDGEGVKLVWLARVSFFTNFRTPSTRERVSCIRD